MINNVFEIGKNGKLVNDHFQNFKVYGTTLRAAIESGRKAYGFEIKKDFFKDACDKVLCQFEMSLF